MPKNNNYDSTLTEKGCAGGFGGIDCRGRSTAAKNACSDIRNLRLLSDGTLRSRSGYNHATTLMSEPRAIMTDFKDGEPVLYALCEDNVICIEPDGSHYTVSYLNTESGDASIFRHGDAIYAIDGYELYRKLPDEEDFDAVSGYVPLYGDGWDPLIGGKIAEPLNLLSRNFRLRFLTGKDGADQVAFRLPFILVNSVRVNGASVTPASIGITATSGDGSPIRASLPPDSEIIFGLSLPWDYFHRTDITSCVNALSVGELSDERICCFGGTNCGEMFFTRPVTDAQLAESQKFFPSSSSIYFPSTSRITFGEGRHPIRSVCRYFNRQLVFTSGDAWVMNWDGKEDDPKVYLPWIRRISPSLGASDPLATLSFDGGVMTFSGRTFFRWSSSSEIATRFTALPVSENIAPLLPEDTSGKVSGAVDEERGEAWFSFADDSEGRCFVWNYRLEAWYVFTGIYADRIFRWGKNIAFIRGQELFVFDDSAVCDTDEDSSSPIPVSVTSNWLDFGHPETLKKGVWVMLRHAGSPLTVTLSDSFGCERKTLMGGPGSRSDTPLEGYAEDRIDIGSFRFLRCSVSSDGSSPVTLRSICLAAD
ncbi:MAG: hypothetical protein MJ102_04670 [Clostridia bacterium]|nr:hypothetical protein [Clostridia bacterium]